MDSSNAIVSNTVSRHEQQYETLRLVLEAAQFPGSQGTAAVPRKKHSPSYRHSRPAKPTQSDKLICLPRALPKPIMEEDISKSGDTVINVGSDGKVATSQQLNPKPLANLEKLVEVFMCAIMPALIEKPRALIDWGASVRSVVQLGRTHSWAAAHKFLSHTLASKINAREAVGDFNSVILTNGVATLHQSSGRSHNAKHRPCPFHQQHCNPLHSKERLRWRGCSLSSQLQTVSENEAGLGNPRIRCPFQDRLANHHRPLAQLQNGARV
jgi:hypothetical protein